MPLVLVMTNYTMLKYNYGKIDPFVDGLNAKADKQ